jgi:hypothetical protein
MPAVKPRECFVEVEELTVEQGRELFERRAQELLGVDTATFLKAHGTGQYPKQWDEEAVLELEMLVPFAS